MTKIKICGIFREEDAAYINESRPDYFGMVIGVPASHRNVTAEAAARIRRMIDPEIPAVGVFVDADPGMICTLLEKGIIQIAQLHGKETDADIRFIRERSRKPVWKAFRIRSAADIAAAENSPADLAVLDNGAGTGQQFDWRLLENMKRPFALAGGLNEANLEDAVSRFHPYLCDLSSGVETDGRKDPQKIRRVTGMIRALNARVMEENEKQETAGRI